VIRHAIVGCSVLALRLGLALAVLVFATIARSPTLAAGVDREDGFLTAYAYTLFPSGARVRLDPRDDAADDLALVAGFRRGLERRGHIVDPASVLVLSFDLVQDDDVSLADRGGDPAGDEALVVQLGQPANQRRRADPGTYARYRLSVAIDDRRTGRRVWSAELLFATDYRDHLGAAQAVVPVLLDSIGQTVNRRSITFD